MLSSLAMRSRGGCAACLQQHRKCDEDRPRCSNCVRRNVECDYSRRYRWMSHAVRRKRTKATGNRNRNRNSFNHTLSTPEESTGPGNNVRDFSTATPSPIPQPQQSDLLAEFNLNTADDDTERDRDLLSSKSPSGRHPSPSDGESLRELMSLSRNPEIVSRAPFVFFLEHVAAVIPALDSLHNPYRELAVYALNSPVLMDTIISVSTQYLHFQGLVGEEHALSRQFRALRSLRESLDSFHLDSSSLTNGIHQYTADLTITGSEVNELASPQEVLATILLQITNEILVGGKGVSLHLNSALHLLHELGYDTEVPDSFIGKWAVQRVAAIDILGSFFWYRRPTLPRDFWFFTPNDSFDESDPSFFKLTGYSHRFLALMARISHLVADKQEGFLDSYEIMSQAHELETELHHLFANKIQKGVSDSSLKHLDTLSSCYYWSAVLILQRRVYHDPPGLDRVQFGVRKLIDLAETIPTGSGPDSSLTFPLHIAVCEAIEKSCRERIMSLYSRLAERYPNGTRFAMMDFTNEIWRRMDTSILNVMQEERRAMEDEIVNLHREKSLFIS